MYDFNDINEKALYVLRTNDKGLFETGYFKIDDSLLEVLELSKLIDFLEKEYPEDDNEAQQLYDEKQDAIINFFKFVYEEYNFLYQHRSYCSRDALSSSYRNFKYIRNPSVIVKETLLSRIAVFINTDSNTFDAFDYIHDFLYSYLLKQAYEECKTNKLIRAYSNRIAGYSSYKYTLNDILSVEVTTNFGYGSACYFLATLIYDGILIIPYSRLVTYYYAKTSELIRHTLEFKINDKSWVDAFDFVRNASNELIETGPTSFIAKYMISECENLTKLLPKFLVQTTFSQSDNLFNHSNNNNTSNTSKSVTLNGIDLMIFRSEKIAGAVNYSENIIKMNKLFPTHKYIECINSCCEEIEPTLSSEISKQTNVLKEMNLDCINWENKRNKYKNELIPIHSRVTVFENFEETIRKKLYDEMIVDDPDLSYNSSVLSELLKMKMIQTFDDYQKVYQIKSILSDKYTIAQQKHNELNKTRIILQNKLELLNKHNSRIVSYLSSL